MNENRDFIFMMKKPGAEILARLRRLGGRMDPGRPVWKFRKNCANWWIA